MVQAVMQITGDEADDDPQSPGSGNRNIVLPVLPSQESADAFAAELTRLVSRCCGFWRLSRVEYEENEEYPDIFPWRVCKVLELPA
jgi:hypothetical protein